MNITVEKAKLAGELIIPASKSHTIRALVIATMADGTSVIQSPLDSGDTRACVEACRLFGAGIDLRETEWIVRGRGRALATPDNVVDVRNSGTTLYIALGMAALCDGWTIFTGDGQIRSRPATPLLASLGDCGAMAFSTRGNGCAPIAVKGVLNGGKTSIQCPTSQYLTSLLINCPLAEGDTEIDVTQLNEVPYVTMTMNWLKEQGIVFSHENYKKVFIKGGQHYKPFKKIIPADFSSATFFLCAAAITGSKLTLLGLDMDDSQGDKQVVEILQQMGCRVSRHEKSLVIEGGALKGGEFDLNSIPDSLPALSVTACFAEGTTRLYNVEQARLKETDRISVMYGELKKMGASVEERPDGLIIQKSPLKGASVCGHSDHRIVMALTIAGLGAEGKTTVDTTESVGITFPDFFTLLKKVTL
ncbi:MAG: 3-phosphoshikimate 1-carboxyvinyltransferase [Spirochaetales bacterium]|nr:3-phosphoshikimate 1-carboxyvinyltransferase [Spirochaetales bacterium]